MMIFTEIDFLFLGLQVAGHSERTINRSKYEKNLKRFEAKFAACPETCRDIYIDLQLTENDDAKVNRPNPKHLLLCLNYLKEYPSFENLAGTFDCTKKTASKWAHFYMQKIQALKDAKIKFLFDEPDLHNEKFIMTVDGIHCQTCEPRTDPSSKWYSHKFNKAAFSYKVGISIFSQQICWINGPFPAGTNDLTIYKNDLMVEKIPEGKLTINDMGYRGAETATHRNPFNLAELKQFKSKALARQETANSRLKRFNILDHRFRTGGPSKRSREERHKEAFESCTVILQYQLENGWPLFEI